MVLGAPLRATELAYPHYGRYERYNLPRYRKTVREAGTRRVGQLPEGIRILPLMCIVDMNARDLDVGPQRVGGHVPVCTTRHHSNGTRQAGCRQAIAVSTREDTLEGQACERKRR